MEPKILLSISIFSLYIYVVILHHIAVRWYTHIAYRALTSLLLSNSVRRTAVVACIFMLCVDSRRDLTRNKIFRWGACVWIRAYRNHQTHANAIFFDRHIGTTSIEQCSSNRDTAGRREGERKIWEEGACVMSKLVVSTRSNWIYNGCVRVCVWLLLA